jgi:YHS domain-containing protein
MPAYSTSSQALTERELEVVRAVSEHFAGLHLETSIMPVHTLEGSEVDTLRFTLSGLASSDLHRERIAGGDTPEQLASIVVMQLRHQLPVKLDEDEEPDAMTAASAGTRTASLPTSQMAHDPVCHMDVRIDDAFGRSTHNGLTYYFCSEGCKQRFDSDADAVLEAESHAHASASV